MSEQVNSIHELITQLYQNDDFKRVLNPFRLHSDSITNMELKRDFEHDLVLIISDYKDSQRLIDMYNRNKNEFMRFLIRITKNNIVSTTSPYWKKYGKWQYDRQPLLYYKQDA